MSRHIVKVAAGLFVLLCLATWRMADSVPLPVVFAQPEQPEIECSSYCSSTKPGVSYIEVRWRLAASPMADAALKTQLAQQKLDVTVYPDGFDQGLFVRVEAMQPKALFRAPVAAGAAGDRARRPPAGLRNLILSEIGTRNTRSTEPMRLLASAADPAGPEWVSVRMEGVEPGIEYTYRIPSGQATTTCQAVVCPVDSPKRPAAAKPLPGPR